MDSFKELKLKPIGLRLARASHSDIRARCAKPHRIRLLASAWCQPTRVSCRPAATRIRAPQAIG